MSGNTDNLLRERFTHYADSNLIVNLHGRTWRIARAVWIALATLSVGIFLVGVPFRFREQTGRRPSSAPGMPVWGLNTQSLFN